MGVDAEQTASAGLSTAASGQKRKRTDEPPTGSRSGLDVGQSSMIPRGLTDDAPTPGPEKKKKNKPKVGETPPEKRLRRFRAAPPVAFDAVYQRAISQRFYVLSRTRCGVADCPEEMVELSGSTGNIYTVVVARQPSCNCPHARAGNQCKHVLYVMSRVLRARFEYTYQLALLTNELRDIFANAPDPTAGEGAGAAGRGGHGNRKPIEGDCPICFGELEASGGEPVVWCRAACGQNIHKECFEMWAATKRQQGAGATAASEVTCPYCRSVWQGDEDMVKKIKMTGKVGTEGYINVADQLGISTVRDTSSYSSWWPGHGKRRRYYAPDYDADDDEEWW